MNVLGALGDEELRPARDLEDLPSARIDLSGDEKGDQLLRHLPKIDIPPHEIILMAYIGIAKRIGIVLKDIDLSRETFFPEALLRSWEARLQQPLSCLVVNHQIQDTVALGCRVFGMAA